MTHPTSRRPRSDLGIVATPLAIVLVVSACLATGLVAGAVGLSHTGIKTSDVGKLSPAVATGVTGATGPSGVTGPSGTTGGTTTTTTPNNPTVTAPAGYANQLDSLYGEIYTAATTVPVSNQTQIMSPSSFQQQVSGLSQADLNSVYTATSEIPDFSQLSATFSKADSTAAEAVRVLHLNGSKSTAQSGTSSVDGSKSSQGSLAGLSGSGAQALEIGLGAQLTAPKSLSNYQPTSPVILYPAASCPNGSPGIDYGETSIFALQVAVDVIAEVVAVLPSGLTTAFGNVTIPNIALIIVAAVQLGVVITHDTFAYLQAVSGDCASAYLASLAANTDNSAYQTYQQLTEVAGTANEIDTNVANLTNQDTNEFDQQLTLDIEQALSAPAGTVPMAAMELPQSLGGYLDSTPVGVNEVVSGAIQAMQSAGQSMSPDATRDESLAEQAFSSGNYKLAFDYYCLAYQAAAG